MKEIPLLGPKDIECRVQQIKETKNGVGVSVLLYKDARVDMRILDDTFGPLNWQRRHTRDNANCVISVWDEEKRCWIEKEDTGTESNTESQKGLASDSFKRAGVNWGIGRELYTAPFIWISLKSDEYQKDKTGKVRVSPRVKFQVEEIGYNSRREIDRLILMDAKGEIRYVLNETKTPKSDDLDSLLTTAREWLAKCGYEDRHGLLIIEQKAGVQIQRLEEATQEQLSVLITYCINVLSKRKGADSQ
ncbi:MAG: hypothetical protein HFK04_03330 [Oscillospiraceae bacterium]|nr:hypothetical protein [Oscillospiraceae bacterium]